MSNVLSVPHRPQLADGYCLPACVQMVLSHLGIERDQTKLGKEKTR
ncbi:MAG: C39 family peptidase [Anaerolineae bacterium]|nr:C39 family peptidase [Anaerolineae bacterium]